MKICVVTPRFAIAGVPLAQIRFARALARRGHSVKLIVGYIEGDFQFPDASPLEVICWNIPKVRSMLWPLVRYMRDEDPEVIFSAEDHLNTMVLIAAWLSGSRAKISGSSRVTPFDTFPNVPFTKRWVLKQLANLAMRRADVLTCVSQDMVNQYREVFASPPHVCVYNIVDDEASRSRLLETVDHPWMVGSDIPLIVAAGRLAPWKGFSTLIEAMSFLLRQREARMLILGDGPLRKELQELIDSKGLTDEVQLLGYVNNPLAYFRHAKVFVLSSLVEGMPNVLVEAMMCGCTPVSTDCPTGPRELLQDGKYGYLVPVSNPEAMADAISKALDRPVPKFMLDEAVMPFHEDTIINRHFKLLGLAECE